MSAEPIPYLSPEEYLALERAAETRSEYYGGQMFAMAGGTKAHNLVAGNLVAELRSHLRGTRYRPYVHSMRVKIGAAGAYTYPDVVVAHAPTCFEDEHQDTLLNPVMIAEISFGAKEHYLRWRKFEHYRRVDSLREYVLIAQDRCYVEVYTRQPDGESWLFRDILDIHGSLNLESLGCSVPLSEIYLDVEFPDPGATGDSLESP